MFPNAKGSEQLSLLTSIDPSNQAAGSSTSSWVALANHHNLLAVIQTGAMANGSTVDAKLQQATDATGTGAKDITGKAITQLAQAANGASRQALINLRPDEVDANNGFTHVRLVLTVATAAAHTAAQLLGLDPRFAPADAVNQAAVAQII
ncbi:MAG: hypothetical protein EBV64_14690 [Oxalobacteraceae bacterium]|jgi:hypothetical protein|nr:hypothetical protein [Oxalobacteraceae bacterium]